MHPGGLRAPLRSRGEVSLLGNRRRAGRRHRARGMRGPRIAVEEGPCVSVYFSQSGMPRTTSAVHR
jgi:hypothetical protein